MSKCPDAIFCESVFARVMQRVGSKAKIDLNFIGTINNAEPKYGVTCMHGESECLGNIHELCAKKISPDSYFGFALCLNKNPSTIGKSDQDLTKCLVASNIPLAQFRTCVSEDGRQLLKESVSYTKSMQMKSSCTILINKQNKCIHDGTWKNCDNGYTENDFVRQIEEAYQN
ncbi:hypothetical protein DSO57_1023370 [Entomophthora muscae]|uniref:Uncharacterized protein n=1 Tax=Entomophthora muscae TaxID=34485 RepID=A0ACC2RTW3_9FUNG|nr:hypothetical protein DSO57_1023370 [Entomophthora muscae]